MCRTIGSNRQDFRALYWNLAEPMLAARSGERHWFSLLDSSARPTPALQAIVSARKDGRLR